MSECECLAGGKGLCTQCELSRLRAIEAAARGIQCACHTELTSGQHWAKCKMPELLAALAVIQETEQ